MKKTQTEETTTSTETIPATPPPPVDATKKTIEDWRDELGTPKWLWAGMKLGKQWPIGKEVTRAEYDAAVDWAAHGVVCR